MSTDQKRYRKDDSTKRKKEPTSNILDRSPPFDLTAEMGVLGSLILNPDVANDLALELRADDFYDDAHRKLYAAMMNLFDSGRKMDTTLLVSELKASGDYELPSLLKAFRTTRMPNTTHRSFEAKRPFVA
jgi:replicative DNA helicase